MNLFKRYLQLSTKTRKDLPHPRKIMSSIIIDFIIVLHCYKWSLIISYYKFRPTKTYSSISQVYIYLPSTQEYLKKKIYFTWLFAQFIFWRHLWVYNFFGNRLCSKWMTLFMNCPLFETNQTRPDQTLIIINIWSQLTISTTVGLL